MEKDVDFVVDDSGQDLVNGESAKPMLSIRLQFVFISNIVLVLQNVLTAKFMFEKDINLPVLIKD